MMLRSKRNKRTNERGSVIVELAIVLPLLMTLLLGMFEITMAWRTTQSLVQGTRSAARTATQLGENDLADQAALKAIEATFGDDAVNITGVIIWEVPQDGNGFPTDDAVPSACLAAVNNSTPISPPAEECNVYGPDDIADIDNPTRFDATGADDDLNCGIGRSSNWCPSAERTARQVDATFIGVWIEYERDYVSHILPGDSHKIRQTAIMRVEPEAS